LLQFIGVWRGLKYCIDGKEFLEWLPWEAEEYSWEPVCLLKTGEKFPRFLRRVKPQECCGELCML